MVRGTAEVVLMASMIVLARLIPPAEFGCFAVAIIAQELAHRHHRPRASARALVQRETVDREHLQAGLALALRHAGSCFMVLDARGGAA